MERAVCVGSGSSDSAFKHLTPWISEAVGLMGTTSLWWSTRYLKACCELSTLHHAQMGDARLESILGIRRRRANHGELWGGQEPSLLLAKSSADGHRELCG